MPELRGQQDANNWMTPNLDTVLYDDEIAHLSDEQLQHIQRVLKDNLSQSRYDVHINETRSMPHYALFQLHADPDIHTNIRNHLSNQLQSGWVVGFQPHTDNQEILDVLIRTSAHHPMTLRQVLMRPPFRKAESPRSVVLGVTLHQQILIRDLENMGHLLVVGDKGIAQNYVRSLISTLLVANTPSSLRIAFVNKHTTDYPHLPSVPHVLGNVVSDMVHGIRLLNGIVREVHRRQTILNKSECTAVVDYNAAHSYPILPPIVLILDGLDSKPWLEQHEAWLSNLTRIIRDGATAGVHIILTVPDLSNELLHPLYATFDSKLMSRTIARESARQIDNFDDSLWQFVDAVLVEEGVMKPVEIPVTTATDARVITTYWRKNAEERLQTSHLSSVGKRTGLTSLFQSLQQETVPAPPVPQTPPAQVLAHAASILSHINQSTQTADELPSTETHTNEADEAAIAVLQTIIDEAASTATQITGISDEVSIQMESIRRAHALASYLGWLGRGPLMDVLGLSVQEAEVIIAILQARQILERSDTPTPRLRSSQSR